MSQGFAMGALDDDLPAVPPEGQLHAFCVVKVNLGWVGCGIGFRGDAPCCCTITGSRWSAWTSLILSGCRNVQLVVIVPRVGRGEKRSVGCGLILSLTTVLVKP